ncbi:phage tail assembly chaperone [Erythrobacter sp. MTPC3]|uniref:phage tail assembly chaperone n=1 Tax=Erythrobacter sp. MTPC3 TaxID=3056564 RepID=UPI0036F2AED4
MSEDQFASDARAWCGIAARVLGWKPADFWQATPAELVMSLGDPAGSAATSAPSRELIQSLMERDANE